MTHAEGGGGGGGITQLVVVVTWLGWSDPAGCGDPAGCDARLVGVAGACTRVSTPGGAMWAGVVRVLMSGRALSQTRVAYPGFPLINVFCPRCGPCSFSLQLCPTATTLLLYS